MKLKENYLVMILILLKRISLINQASILLIVLLMKVMILILLLATKMIRTFLIMSLRLMLIPIGVINNNKLIFHPRIIILGNILIPVNHLQRDKVINGPILLFLVIPRLLIVVDMVVIYLILSKIINR